jgi:hypothetical protein
MPIIPSSNPGSKAISLAGTQTCGSYNQSIEKELSGPGTASISINCSSVRSLLGVPSGAISFSNAYGKSSFPGKMIVMAMGGGGGATLTGSGSGGGGAGGYQFTPLTGISGSTSFAVTIGCGGPPVGTYPYLASPGSPTTIVGPITITGYGGAQAGHANGLGYPGPGAGGGGGGFASASPGVNATGLGGSGNYPGGCAIATHCPAHYAFAFGGGGGAGGAGVTGTFTNPSPTGASGGCGGAGVQFLDGITYGGGGGGSHATTCCYTGIPTPYVWNSHYGVGGPGGGGTGNHYTPTGTYVSSTPGTPGTGGGGGGGGGSGGPGAAVFIYSSPTQLATGGDTITNHPTLSFSPYFPAPSVIPMVGCGPYWIHKFITPGTFIT